MTPPSPAKKGRGKKENNVLISFYEFKKNCHITPEGSISPREKCLVCQMVSPALPAIHLQLFSISTRETWQPYSHTRKKKKRKKKCCVQPGPGESTQKAARAKRSFCSLQGWLAAAGWNQFDSNPVHPGNTLWQSGLFVSYFTYFVCMVSVDLPSILRVTSIPRTSCPRLLRTHAKM